MKDFGTQFLNGINRNGLVKSIQTFDILIGTNQTSNTATITSVDLNNSMLVFGGINPTLADGSMSAGNMHAARAFARLTFTNATTITATRAASDPTYTVNVTGTVIEFFPGVIKSVQRGTVSLSTTSATDTLAQAVDVNKAFVSHLGQTTTSQFDTTPGNGLNWYIFFSRLDLQNGTTVRSREPIANGDSITSYQVVEFF